MKALQAIYNQGQIDFLFTFPETAGPVNVLVIFPEEVAQEEIDNPFVWDETTYEEGPTDFS